jgi:hypothetical protein
MTTQTTPVSDHARRTARRVAALTCCGCLHYLAFIDAARQEGDDPGKG